MQTAFFSLAPTSMGPICSHKGKTSMSADNETYTDLTLFNLIEDGIILQRLQGNVLTNIPHLVTHHSPTGFEFGYAGSGPADLALNICEMMLNRLGYQGEREKCWRGDCWRRTFELHQAFKFKFIAGVDQAGAVIPYAEVEAWFKEHIPEK